MRLSSRRSDDADVIRRRLRLLLEERDRPGGWVPDDLGDEDEFPDVGPGDDTVTAPLEGTGATLPGGIGRHRAPGPEARSALPEGT